MIHILFYDEALAVCVKPRGVLSEGEGENAMPALLRETLEKKRAKGQSFCVHRLDRETAGLMVWARTAKAAAALSRSISEGTLEKEYFAVLCGKPDQPSGRLEDLLFYDRAKGQSFVVKGARKGVKQAVLDYETVAQAADKTLVRVHLMTGRTHQIRVQFASRGLPLAGDRRYGAPAEGSEMGLYSHRLRFPHPISGEILEFCSLPPTEDKSPFAAFADSLTE